MQNLTDLWNQAAHDFADRTAVICEDRDYTYADLDVMIRSLAASLPDMCGIAPGDRVALVMPNCLHSIVCYLAVIRAGATALPVNIRLKADEMRFILQDAGVGLAFVHSSVWPTVREALGTPSPCPVFGVDFCEEGVAALANTVCGGGEAGACSGGPGDVASIIYTSGTTGLPKGAMITHGNILFNVKSTIRGHGFRSDDVHILVVPLFHVTGLNTIMPTAFHQGATLVVTAKTTPTDILELVAKHRATTFFAVPTTMILLAQTPGLERFDVSSLRLIAYSGAPMPVRTIARLREGFPGVRLHNFFGLTETTSVTSVLPDEQALVRPESIGRAVPELECKVVDETGATLPPGQVGELLVRGPSVVKGYYNRPEATTEAIVDGWLHTGDTALIDDEGYIFLQGRKKEMLIVAGENVYPVEVENLLTRHPAVAEVAVIGVPHPILGEVAKAVVVVQSGVECDARELRRYCTERLASYKVPQSFEFRDSLPRNPSGKVVKRELKPPSPV
jgi:long-chain acyl-CoA synthetase